MTLEDVLRAIVACGEVHLVVKNAGVTAELRGQATISSGEEWLTIELLGTPDHLHVRRCALIQAEFLTEAAKNRGVRFTGHDDQVILTCHVRGTAESRPEYSAERRAAFDEIAAQYHGTPERRGVEKGS
jgi:hypothetical protein